MKVTPLHLPPDEIKRDLEPLRHPLRIAVLRAKNPFNIGAIIRTAHSFLVKEIFLVGDEDWYRRAAMGMDRYENIVELPDERALVDRARANGWKLVVFEKDHATVSLWQTPLPGECVMVFGNEDHGVGEELAREADLVVGIPMYGVNHSYPVAVAAGIAIAEWTRRFVGPRGLDEP